MTTQEIIIELQELGMSQLSIVDSLRKRGIHVGQSSISLHKNGRRGRINHEVHNGLKRLLSDRRKGKPSLGARHPGCDVVNEV